MPPRPIQFIQGGHYHIYNRGVNRQSIFQNEDNYLYLLRLLKRIAAECAVSVLAYALLPNHYHWLLRQDGETPAGKVPTRVFNSYTQAYNLANSRSGVLFESRYQLIHVESDEYLHQLCRYIHCNPVRHGLVSEPEAWIYSNYRDCIGVRVGTLVDHEFIRAHFGSVANYQAYVMSYVRGEVVLPAGLGNYLAGIERIE
jgi:REP element-mobilizing transposase RayT